MSIRISETHNIYYITTDESRKNFHNNFIWRHSVQKNEITKKKEKTSVRQNFVKVGGSIRNNLSFK